MDDVQVTPHTARVLKVFLPDPSAPQYVYDLMLRVPLSSGTLYQILYRLTAAGWMTRAKENIDPAAAGRPARVNYTLTTDGAAAARSALTALADTYRPPQ